jgi:hypothetical protein
MKSPRPDCEKTHFVKSMLVITALIFFIFCSHSHVQADEYIWIDGSDSVGVLSTNITGFLQGVDLGQDLSDSLTELLTPKSWRLSKLQSLQEAIQYSPKITYVLSDRYAWNNGGYQQVNPWNDWAEYENFTLQTVQSLEYYYPGAIEYWDIWNEPDHPYFWHGTYEQLLELFARTFNVVKTVDPEAKIVGPSVSWYQPGNPGVANVTGFLHDLDSLYGVKMGVVSWHENNSMFDTGIGPERIPSDAAQIRASLEYYFGPEYQPELHINEFAGMREHLSPGFSLGYLYYLDMSGVDQAMRACWNVYSQYDEPFFWCDCWGGLDGMFMEDGSTPQVVYWIYKAYSDMAGLPRIATTFSETNSCVMAVKNDSTETIQILAGRYRNENDENVVVSIQEYPYQHDSVVVQQWSIPHHPEFFESRPRAIAMPEGPVDWRTRQIEVIGNSLAFDINNFEPNDAYFVTVENISQQTNITEDADISDIVLAAANYPNPFNAQTVISYSLLEASNVTIDIFDIVGRKMKTMAEGVMPAGEHSVIWDASGQASGIYFYRIKAGDRVEIKRMALLK